jgi:Lipid A 3-O-deacylase (PagL)
MPFLDRRALPPNLRAGSARVAGVVLVPLALAFGTVSSSAFEVDLLSVGIRGRVSEQRVLGQQHPVSFDAYDLAATMRLPWQKPLSSEWVAGARLMGSAGAVQGAGKTAWVISLIPSIAFDRLDGRFTVDVGLGLAVLGRRRYAQQDFGGPLQFALTLGASVPLHERIALGYRFLHYSDARAYGGDTIGAEFHMIELAYRF